MTTVNWSRLLASKAYVILLMALLLSLPACGGIGLAYEYNLTQEYAVWAPDLRAQAAVVRKDAGGSGATVVVRAMVFAFGWNEDFIIAQQHPNLDGFDEIDETTTHWFIVDVTQDRVHGSLTQEEFAALRARLGVPQELTFTQTITP